MEVRSLKLEVRNIEKINDKRKEREQICKRVTEGYCKGITLIALVITIIVLLILAGVTLNLTIGENGIFTVAKRAKEETIIAQYKEKIELIRANLLIDNKEYRTPNLDELEAEFNKNKDGKKEYDWINKTERIIEGKEKIKLTTKEGYILYITEEGTEYRGKGEVKDISELQNEGVIRLEIAEEKQNEVSVRITDLTGKNYYDLKYQIREKGEEVDEGGWKDVQSKETVAVAYGKVIYAKLVFKTESGKVHTLSIDDTDPTVVLKSIDTSDLERKTEITMADIFDITWGSEGNEGGTVKYIVKGKMNFKNTEFLSENIQKIGDLEIGEYEIKCEVNSKTKRKAEVTKENVNITKLARSTVKDEIGTSVEAKGIYSEYDLVYFKDLINTKAETTLNGKILEDINLLKVCSSTEGQWEEIGLSTNKYEGIFDGNEKRISNIYINNNTQGGKGLFGYTNNARISNIILGSGIIKAQYDVGGIVGNNNEGTIINCKNEGTQIEANGSTNVTNTWFVQETVPYSNVGGIVGYNYNGSISGCENSSNIKGSYGAIGGIVGFDEGNKEREINDCKNFASFSNTGSGSNSAGGIVGSAFERLKVQRCTNTGNIETNDESTGGIIGVTANSKIIDCYNGGEIKGKECVGGITGLVCAVNSLTNYNKIENCTNEGTIKNTGYVNFNWVREGEKIQCNVIGGIVGEIVGCEVEGCKNNGIIESQTTYKGIGGIVGLANTNGNSYTNSIKYCSNVIDIVKNVQTENVGGIVGISNGCTIEECYNIGDIKGTNCIGGISGRTSGITIKNCYNKGKISGADNVGGIFGEIVPLNLAYGTEYLYNCYNLGIVEGTENLRDCWGGKAEYLTWDHVYTTKTVYDQIGDGYWPNSKQGGQNYATLSGPPFMIKRDMLTGLLNGEGANKWTRDTDSTINDGYPYLVNNEPD